MGDAADDLYDKVMEWEENRRKCSRCGQWYDGRWECPCIDETDEVAAISKRHVELSEQGFPFGTDGEIDKYLGEMFCMDSIIEVLHDRYYPLAEKCSKEVSEKLQKMLDILKKQSLKWPVDKFNRWLGFVQGVLWSNGLIDIKEERDFTRPLFHKYYSDRGIVIPKTVEV